jgi:hypothetical protein
VASKRCPKCGLVNRATAERCDCGRSFVDGSLGATLGQRLAKGKPGEPSELRDAHDAALRRARRWILGVGITMFLFDQISLQIVNGQYLTVEDRLLMLVIDGLLLGFFVAMYIVAKTRPLGACIAALCVFWGLNLVVAIWDPSSLISGIIVKILFTVALIRGIKSASRASSLQKELAEIFS